MMYSNDTHAASSIFNRSKLVFDVIYDADCQNSTTQRTGNGSCTAVAQQHIRRRTVLDYKLRYNNKALDVFDMYITIIIIIIKIKDGTMGQDIVSVYT